MRRSITISLPDPIAKEAERYCSRHSKTFSEITRDALKDYLFKRGLDDIRRRFTASLQARGITTEQDLEDVLER